MMRITLAIGLVAATTLMASAQARQKPDDVSWGKHGVSFEDYQRDTLECANKTYGLDVSVRPKTVAALSAQNNIALATLVGNVDRRPAGDGGYAGGAAGYAAAMQSVDPHRVVYRDGTYTERFRHAAYVDVTERLQAVLDYCLTQRGYTRFKLDADQRQQLHRYRRGTEERARYLHTLSAQFTPGSKRG